MEINDIPIEFQRYLLISLYANTMACKTLAIKTGLSIESWAEAVTNKASHKVLFLSDQEVEKQLDQMLNKKTILEEDNETNRPTN